MIARRFSFLRDTRATAAAEMALCLPIVLALMFGGLEAGNFYFREHQVIKAAREGARFAGRQSMAAYDCNAQKVDAAAATKVEDLVAEYLFEPTVEVKVAPCIAGSATGLYNEYPNGAPIAVVQVWVPYPSLFSTLGFDTDDMTLHAAAQSAVMGL